LKEFEGIFVTSILSRVRVRVRGIFGCVRRLKNKNTPPLSHHRWRKEHHHHAQKRGGGG